MSDLPTPPDETFLLDRAHALTGHINAVAGNAVNGGWEAAAHQLKIIDGEYQELCAAIREKNLYELRDGLADLLFTLSGLAYRCGLPMGEDWMEVVRSNLTKFDRTEDSALLTKTKYQAMGIDTRFVQVEDSEGVHYVTRSSHDQVVNGKAYPKDKWLKSHHFVDTRFMELEEGNLLLPSVESVEAHTKGHLEDTLCQEFKAFLNEAPAKVLYSAIDIIARSAYDYIRSTSMMTRSSVEILAKTFAQSLMRSAFFLDESDRSVVMPSVNTLFGWEPLIQGLDEPYAKRLKRLLVSFQVVLTDIPSFSAGFEEAVTTAFREAASKAPSQFKGAGDSAAFKDWLADRILGFTKDGVRGLSEAVSRGFFGYSLTHGKIVRYYVNAFKVAPEATHA